MKTKQNKETVGAAHLRILCEDHRPPSKRPGTHRQFLRPEHPARPARRHRHPRVIEIVTEPPQETQQKRAQVRIRTPPGLAALSQVRHNQRHQQVPAASARGRIVQVVHLEQLLEHQDDRLHGGKVANLVLDPLHRAQAVAGADGEIHRVPARVHLDDGHLGRGYDVRLPHDLFAPQRLLNLAEHAHELLAVVSAEPAAPRARLRAHPHHHEVDVGALQREAGGARSENFQPGCRVQRSDGLANLLLYHRPVLQVRRVRPGGGRERKDLRMQGAVQFAVFVGVAG